MRHSRCYASFCRLPLVWCTLAEEGQPTSQVKGWPPPLTPVVLQNLERVEMQSRNPAVRKSREPARRPRGLLSVRSALVLGFAVLAALGGAGLLYAAHRPVALVVLGAVGIFAAALKLLDSMIELKAMILHRRRPGIGLTVITWFWLGLRSGDGPLSVRVRPSSLKRDCGRKDNEHRWNVPGERTREVTLDPGDLCGHSGQKTRARPEPARTGRGPSPASCKVRSRRPRHTS
jgi:hypothetical protein